VIKNSQFRTQENSGWKHERNVGKRRAGLSYSKYLSSDQKGPGSELLSEPKSYPPESYTRFCPDAKRDLVGEESQAAVPARSKI
jgi:hypothetical protein